MKEYCINLSIGIGIGLLTIALMGGFEEYIEWIR